MLIFFFLNDIIFFWFVMINFLIILYFFFLIEFFTNLMFMFKIFDKEMMMFLWKVFLFCCICLKFRGYDFFNSCLLMIGGSNNFLDKLFILFFCEMNNVMCKLFSMVLLSLYFVFMFRSCCFMMKFFKSMFFLYYFELLIDVVLWWSYMLWLSVIFLGFLLKFMYVSVYVFISLN